MRYNENNKKQPKVFKKNKKYFDDEKFVENKSNKAFKYKKKYSSVDDDCDDYEWNMDYKK